ncbi:FkbM family methyltransferase [Saccharothrix longispora]|uniref:FkbM family methyltransferase n=1 Tax=Saccharothrix longispora TaxID=33920 RepID=UPI0028FD245C|nr:FkbM family methyltransferase [Saccharothrix longispora]MDU0294320.1 FkbM family methyltransferase [Saccharothrix longispora]
MTDLELVELTDDFSCYVPPGGLGAGIFSEIRFIHSEVWTSRVYLAHGIDLPDDAVVLDIGAHVGLFSLFVKHEHPGATVLAFEPIPVTAQALRANLELHEVDGVHVANCGLGATHEDAVEFSFYPGVPGNSTRYPEQKNRSVELSGQVFGPQGAAEAKRQFDRREVVTTPVERLSRMLAHHPGLGEVDLVKIDVEGAEMDVLDGIDEADWPRFRQFVIEVQDLDGQVDRVRACLEAHDYDVNVVTPQGMPEALLYRAVYAIRK